jgi:hypothetical protein
MKLAVYLTVVPQVPVRYSLKSINCGTLYPLFPPEIVTKKENKHLAMTPYIKSSPNL